MTVVQDETKAATHRIFLDNLLAAAEARRAAQHGEHPSSVPPSSNVVGRHYDARLADGSGRNASGGAAPPAALAAAAPVLVGVDTGARDGAGSGTGGRGECGVGGVGGGNGRAGGVGSWTRAGHLRHDEPIGVGTPVVGPDIRARLTQDTTMWQVLMMRIPTTNPGVVTCLAFHLADLFINKIDIERSHGFKKASGGARGRSVLEIGQADPLAEEHLPDRISLVKSFVNPIVVSDGGAAAAAGGGSDCAATHADKDPGDDQDGGVDKVGDDNDGDNQVGRGVDKDKDGGDDNKGEKNGADKVGSGGDGDKGTGDDVGPESGARPAGGGQRKRPRPSAPRIVRAAGAAGHRPKRRKQYTSRRAPRPRQTTRRIRVGKTRHPSKAVVSTALGGRHQLQATRAGVGAVAQDGLSTSAETDKTATAPATVVATPTGVEDGLRSRAGGSRTVTMSATGRVAAQRWR